MPSVVLISHDFDAADLDTDVWVDACVRCDATDNNGNAFCRHCDD